MTDYGAPTSYLAVAKGTPVITSDGAQIGHVAHVLAVPEDDIFDGIVIAIDGGYRFVDAPEVGQMYEGGVVLKITMAEAEELPEPGKNPGALNLDPADVTGVSLGEKLRRAWNVITGKY